MAGEKDETFGVESYDRLFRQILLELGITRMVERFQLYIKPEEPVFIISMRTGRARSAIKVSDIASVDSRPSGTYLTIIEESYAPTLLSRLWQKYGRERVEQITRFEIMIRGADSEEVSKMELDPGEELRKKLLDAVWRLLPEGFKVRHDLISERALTIVATEHAMKDEWLEKAEEIHQSMEGK